MERSVRSGTFTGFRWKGFEGGSFAYIQARHLQLLLADSYMCLPSDFPRPSYHMIAAIRTDNEGGAEKQPIQE